MAYGLRIRIEYKDINEVLTRINIYQDGYSGVADIRYANSGIKLEWGDQGADELETVYGSSCTIFFDSEFDYEFLYLFSSDARKHLVEIEKSGLLLWKGYIEPDSWSEPLTATPYPVECTAYDGLGFLKDIPFLEDSGASYEGKKTMFDIIQICLRKTGLDLTINTAIDWEEQLQAAGTDLLKVHKINCDALAELSCFEVLEQLLHECRIFQRSGAWWIISNSYLTRPAISYFITSPSGTTSTGILDLTASGFWFEDEMRMQVLPAFRELMVVQDYGYKPNLLKNGSFDQFNENGFEGWLNYGVTPQQRVLDGAEKYVYLPGKQYPADFDDEGYGLITYGIKVSLPVNQSDSTLSIALKYALMGTKYSSLMFIGVKIIGAADSYFLRRVRYFETSEVPWEWVNYNDVTRGADYICLKSHTKESSYTGIELPHPYYNTFDNVTAYPFDKISDHFESFKASVAGVPTSGTLEVYLYVPYTNRTEITGACYAGVKIEMLDENEEKYPSQKSFKSKNTQRNNFVPDEITSLIGDYPDNQNANTIYAGGITRANDTLSTGWKVTGSADYFTYAGLVALLKSSSQRLPRQSYEVRLADMIPGLNLIITDENNPGRRFVENGISYDDRFQAVDGRYIEILTIDFSGLTIETATDFSEPSSSKTTVVRNSGNTEQLVSLLDANGATVSAAGYLNADYFEAEIDPETGITKIKTKLEATAPLHKPAITSIALKYDPEHFQLSENSEFQIKDGRYWLKSELVRDANNYLSIDAAKIKSGYSDNSGLLNGLADTKFLRRDIDQTVAAKTDWQAQLTALSGFKAGLAGTAYLEMLADLVSVKKNIGSESYASGFAGSGWRMDQTDNRLTVDYLTVRKEMSVYELIINQIRSTNGALWVSDAAKIASVTDGGSYWKCNLDTDGGNAAPPFVSDDWIRCQKWTGRGIKYYSAKVTSVGADYFNITKTGIDGAGTPAAGDTVVRIGNSTNSSRQGAIYLTSSDSNSPYMDVLDGVVSASLAGKTKVRLGKLDGITDPQMGALSGYGLYADNVYLKGIIYVTGGNAETQTGAQSKASAAQTAAINAAAADATTKANAAQVSSENYASGLVSGLQGSLGAMAYENLVNLAKLDSTIIQGGYIKSSLLDVNTIRVTGSLATITEAQGYASNAQSAAAADATAKVNAVQVGGRNYIKNSEIKSLDGWIGYNSALSIIDNSIRIIGNSQYLGVYTAYTQVLDAQKEVTISFHVKNNRSVPTPISLFPNGNSGVEVGIVPANSEWVRLTRSFIPAHYQVDMINAYNVYIYSIGDIDFQLKKVKIEYGNRATDHTPAPEDVAADATAKANAAQTSAQNYASGLYDSLNSAKQDAIVSGKTLIIGGYLNTDFIQAGSIVASKIVFDGATGNNVNLTGQITANTGKIGGFNISGSGIVNDDGLAYVICRNTTDGREAMIGTSVFPLAGSGVSYFRNELYNPYATNYAVYAKARNAGTQYYGEKGYYAGYFDGHVKVVNGDLEVSGQMNGIWNIPDSHIYHMGNAVIVNNLPAGYYLYVGDNKTANRDYQLPDASSYKAGTVIRIVNWNNNDSYIRPYNTQTINGYTKDQRYITLSDPSSTVCLRSNGSNQWTIVYLAGTSVGF